MSVRRGGGEGAYIVKRAGKGSHVMGTIATPAGDFRTIRKDVFDRAIRSANSVLRQGGPKPAVTRDDVGER